MFHPLLLSFALLVPLASQAQVAAPEGPARFGVQTGLGWAASMPDAMLGAGGFYMFGDRRWGLYADVKIPHDSDRRSPDFQGNLSLAQVQEFEEQARIEVRSSEEWRLLNLAVIRALSPQSTLFAGGGLARKSVIREFGDNTETPLTRTGFYFVEDENLSGWHPNFTFGMILRGGERVIFLSGFESATASFSLGILLVIR